MSQANSKNSEWAKLLSEALVVAENRPSGAGWKTVFEVMKDLAISQKRAAKLLSLPSVERFHGTSIKNGRLSLTVWYRIKSK